MKYLSFRVPAYFVLVFVLLTFNGLAQKGKLDISYTVSIASVEKQQFHVTTEIKNINQASLDLAR